MKRRMLMHALVYSLIAMLALAAGAQALPGKNTVDSGDIINGQVKRPDLAKNAVNSPKVANGSLKGIDIKDGSLGLADLGADSVDSSKVADGSLTGADVANSSLTGADVANGSLSGVDISDGTVTGSDVANGSLTGADVFDSSLTGADIANNSLTGADVNEASLNYGGAGCHIGLVHSFARIKGGNTMPSSFTSSSTFVDTVHTCTTTSNTVFVRRTGVGVYEVIFAGDPAALAMATVHTADGDNDNTIGLRKISSTTFQVIVRDQSGSLDDGWFQMMTF